MFGQANGMSQTANLIRRFDEQGDLPAPQLWLNPDVKDFFEFDNSRDCKDVKLLNYEHLGKIKFPIAQ